MQTACASPQARAGIRTVTSPGPSGATVTSQTGRWPLEVTRAPVTLPPVASKIEAASRFADSPAGVPLNCTPRVNAVPPSWLFGTLWKTVSGPVLRDVVPNATVPLCASSASIPLALWMVPPLRARLSGATAMEPCEPSPETSVYSKTSSVVPVPLA